MTALDRNLDAIGHMIWKYALEDYAGTGLTNLVQNGGFESGAASWTATAGAITTRGGASRPAHTGSWKLWLGGNGTTSHRVRPTSGSPSRPAPPARR